MADQLPGAVAGERPRVLRELAGRKNLEFRRRFLGRTLEVITLQSGDGSWTEALSDNYLKVRISGAHPANSWMKVEVSDVESENLLADLAEEPFIEGAL